MKPFFDECIDDFGLRLRNFVTTAGVNLYKGITEVLEKTVEERRAGADSIGALVEATRNDSLEIVKLRHDLDRARDSIWQRSRAEEAADQGAETTDTSSTSSSPTASPLSPPPHPEALHELSEDDIEEMEDIEDDSYSSISDESRKDLN